MRRSTSSGIFALLAIGSFVAWRNRFAIRRFFEAQGVSLPLNTQNLSETVRSGAAKVAGMVDRGRQELSKEENSVRKAI